MEVISEVERISNKNKEILKYRGRIDYSMYEFYQQYDYFYNTNKILNYLDLFKLWDDNISEKTFSCHSCNYTTSKFFNLKRHFSIHTGEKQHRCDACEYCSTERDKLRRHQLTHTSDKPFACLYCEYTCRERKNLKENVLSHSGEKPFLCSDCGYLSTRANNLKRHRMRHSGLKPYACSLCEYTSSAVDTLSKHKKRVHGGNKSYVKRTVCTGERVTKEKRKNEALNKVKLVSCPDCTYTSSRTNNLKRHRMTHTSQKFKVGYS